MSGAEFLPDRKTVTSLRQAVQGCRGWSILRAPDEETRREEYARFVADLRVLERGVHDRRGTS